MDPGSVDEVMRQVNEGFIPTIKEGEGFLAYYALDAGGGEIATVSIFEDRTGAEESIGMAADFIRQNMASLLPNPPEITAGEVRAHELNLTKRSTLRQRTECALAEADRLHPEHAVEAASVVLPCDGRRQLNELRVVEAPTQFIQKLGR